MTNFVKKYRHRLFKVGNWYEVDVTLGKDVDGKYVLEAHTHNDVVGETLNIRVTYATLKVAIEMYNTVKEYWLNNIKEMVDDEGEEEVKWYFERWMKDL